MKHITLGGVSCSRLILGGNPFSGNSHQTPEVGKEMLKYFTVKRIKDIFREAEDLGIDTFLGRADRHIIRTLLEYWDEGGRIQWFAQTCPEMASVDRSISDAVKGGAVSCYLHGGMMDRYLAAGQLDEVPEAIETIRCSDMPAGIAGHDPGVFEWSEKNLDVDYYMCCYYNPSSRAKSAEYDAGQKERYLPEDRQAKAELIQTLSKPAIHYKVLAAGRNEPEEALRFVSEHIRDQDAVCIGVYPKEKPDMLREDARILEKLAVI